jgi:hypothetical protein
MVGILPLRFGPGFHLLNSLYEEVCFGPLRCLDSPYIADRHFHGDVLREVRWVVVKSAGFEVVGAAIVDCVVTFRQSHHDEIAIALCFLSACAVSVPPRASPQATSAVWMSL